MVSTVELTLRYTMVMVDVHCRNRADECERGISLLLVTVIQQFCSGCDKQAAPIDN